MPRRLIPMLLFLGIAVLTAVAAEEPHLHLLYLDSSGFRLEPFRLGDGESRSFVIDRDSALVDVIYTVGPGTSGNVIQRSANAYTVTVRRDGDVYRCSTKKNDGPPRNLPSLPLADLGTYRMRLDVTAADGREKAFVVEGGLRVQDNVPGPVMDMFRGLVPLSPGDVSVMTRTEVVRRAAAPPAVAGEADLVYDSGLLFTQASIGPGDPLELIVDFAAGATVLARSSLPDGVEVRAVEGVEYSELGARTIEATMKGAGGDVSGFLGTATLSELTVGTMVFRDVKVSVLSSLPEIGGHRPEGILGTNLLSRASVACVTYPARGENGHLRLGPRSHLGSAETIGLPFARIGNHLFVEGTIDGAPITFILDTGARRAHVHPEAADAARLALRPDDVAAGTRGLDGNNVETRLATVERLRLGDAAFDHVPFVVADLPVFRTIGLGGRAGLLGNSFLDRFAEVEIDFERETIRLLP
jgi:hypothetical protein